MTLEEAGHRKEAKRLGKGEEYNDVLYISYVSQIQEKEKNCFCEL
jgi:hypothetical protein